MRPYFAFPSMHGLSSPPSQTPPDIPRPLDSVMPRISEMFGIIGIKERDRHAPIVLGNVPDLRHLDGIVVVIMRIARRVVAVAAAEDEVSWRLSMSRLVYHMTPVFCFNFS